MIRLLMALATFVLLSGSYAASAETIRVGEVSIEYPWSRASVHNAAAGVAYMTLAAHGSELDRLIRLSTPAADRAEIHSHRMQDGTMMMDKLQAIELAPGVPAIFKPGGLHVMLIGLKKPLKEGDKFPLTLEFERAGSVTIDVPVQKITTLEFKGAKDGK